MGRVVVLMPLAIAHPAHGVSLGWPLADWVLFSAPDLRESNHKPRSPVVDLLGIPDLWLAALSFFYQNGHRKGVQRSLCDAWNRPCRCRRHFS